MPEFNKPHIDISQRVVKRSYQAPRRNMGGGSAPRIREKHGARILAEMRSAFTDAESTIPSDDRLEEPSGVFVEVDLRKGANPEAVLERKKDNVRTAASQKIDDEQTRVALFVPDDAREVVESIIDEYTSGPLTAKGRPQRKDKVEPIEAIRPARLETFWTDDPEALPQESDNEIWWEAWCFKGMEAKVTEAANSLNCPVADDHYWLHFPEFTIIQIRTNRLTMELLLFATSGIAELRRARAVSI